MLVFPKNKAFITALNILLFVYEIKATEYPDEVSPFISEYGCIPWIDGQCPARMICYIDITYAYWGQCGCRNGWLYRMAPPKNLGNELAPPFHRNDCVGMGMINIVSFIALFSGWLIWLYMFVGSILNIYRTYKNGGLKWNSSTTAFLMFPLVSLSEVLRQMVFWTNRVGLDPVWAINDNVLKYPNLLGGVFGPWMVRRSVA